MTSAQWTRVREVLNQALDRPPEVRAEWVAATCADEPAVRDEVESLLAAHEPDDPLFDATDAFTVDWFAEAPAADADGAAISPAPGTRVGPYRLQQEIGVGGMSVVYRAERADDAFERTVAVKLLRRRIHDGEAEQRFRAEQQVLASLHHPNIAGLIDGGVTDRGRPYLVVEYVEGRPIVEYADEHGLGTEARLDLLAQVFEAVQAAHRQLVVHRDLKPANVLVANTEAGPQVKLLDFGIAKLLDDSFPGPRPHTRTGHYLMTPSYAAPEQMTGGDISTATDVYQLGVLAYELLAGQSPFDLADKSLTEVERIVCSEAPPRPSAHASDRARSLRGDLDRILQKTLRKEPKRRYGSVEALAADVRRYRNGEPVAARSATLRYRASKFVRRHRWGLGVAGAFVVLVVVSLTLLLEQRNRARQEARTAEQVTQYLTDLFEEADPNQSQGTPTTAQDLLRQGSEQIDELENEPAAQAELAFVLGKTRRRLGLYDSTRVLLERALSIRRRLHGREHSAVAETLGELALLVRDQEGDYAEAESLMHESVAIYRAVYGPRHPEVAEGLKNLVYVQRRQGKLSAAERSVRGALSIQRAQPGPDSMAVAESLFNLAAILRDRQQYAKAESIQRQSLALCRKYTDGPHPGTAANLHNLAFLLQERDSLSASENMYRKALTMERALFGTPHPEVASSIANLSGVLQLQGDLESAESLLRDALQMRRALHEGPHPRTAGALINLGDILFDLEQFQAADSSFRAARRMYEALDQAQSPDMASLLKQHGELLAEQTAYREAEAAFQQALQIREQMYGPDHSTVETLRNALQSLPPTPDSSRRTSAAHRAFP